jgi:hypothetical protein
MRMKWSAAILAACCIALSTGSALAQNVPTIDCQVKNTKGEKIGKVEALIIDKDEGFVAYAILSFGGFLGVGEKLYGQVPHWNSTPDKHDSNSGSR